MQPLNTSALPIRLLGLGSPIGTDQIGWLAIHQLDATGFKEHHPANLLEIDICQLPVFLVTQFSSAQALILLDAYCSDDPVGSVRRFTVEELDTVHRPASSHGFDLKQALALFNSLEKEHPPVSVIGICIGVDAADAESPYKILEKSFPVLVEAIDMEIKEHMEKPSGLVRTTLS